MADEEATPRQSSPSQSGSQKSNQHSNNPLKEIVSQSGLGGLFGHSHHGLGLLPVCFVET